MATRLLCAGDIHIGRRPTGLTPEAEDQLDRSALSPAAVWRQVVDLAIELRVDAVLLAGDVVEQRDDVYEAYTHLSTGVERLVDSGIDVIGVAGNHDGLALPRLAKHIPRFRLLGRDGCWEDVTVEGSDGSKTRILGWSFPGEHFNADPLVDLPGANGSGLPTLGLLHCDRDASERRYAPVRSSALTDASVDAWLLGHIHRPDPLQGSRPIGYLGAITPLDPSDEGPRGPWLVEVEGRGDVHAMHLPIAPLRFEPATLEVDTLEDAGGLMQLVIETIERLHAELGGSEHRPRIVGLRLRLEGRTRLRSELDAEIIGLKQMPPVPREGILYFVQKVTNASLPQRDLRQIAEGGSDPYSLLASRLLALEQDRDDPECRRLIDEARKRLDSVRSNSIFVRLETPSPNDDEVVELLRLAALSAMDELERRREEPS